MTLELGQKGNCLFFYRLPIDRLQQLFAFGWLRFSYGHQYESDRYWNISGERKFDIDVMLAYLKKDHDETFEKLKTEKPSTPGYGGDTDENLLLEQIPSNFKYGFVSKDLAIIKQSFLADLLVPEIMK